MAFLKYDDAIYVGGEWQKTDQREAVINPADESLLIEAPVGSAAQVDAALTHVADGSYGRCVDCDEPIAPARLAARPAALRCAECQGYAERSEQQAARTHA